MDINNTIVSIAINGTTKCTLACKYCGMYKTVNPQSLTFSQIEQAVNLIKSKLPNKNYQFIRILFNAADMMLYYDSIIKPFIEKYPEYRYMVHSNGLLLFDDRLDFFKRHDVKLNISLDGPQHVQDINRLSKNGKSIYKYVYDAIQRAKSKQLDLVVISTFNEKSLPFLYEVFRYHIEEQNNFSFLFDIKRTSYSKLQNIAEIKKQSDLIGKFYKTLSQEQQGLFSDLRTMFDEHRPLKFNFSISYNRIQMRLHQKHQYIKLWKMDNDQWIANFEDDFKITDDYLVSNIICGKNHGILCDICPLGKNHNINNPEHIDYYPYCELYVAIFRQLNLLPKD